MSDKKSLQPVHLEFIPMERWGVNRENYAPLSWEVSFRVLSDQREEIAKIRFVSGPKGVKAVVSGKGKQYESEVKKTYSEGYEAIKGQLDRLGFRCADPWFKKPIDLCFISCSGREECYCNRHKTDCLLKRISGSRWREPERIREQGFAAMVECQEYKEALMVRRIPTAILVKHIDICRTCGKSPEEQEKLKIRFARDIRKSYPYKPGRDPASVALYQDLQDRGITWQNWLESLEDRTDEEITCMLNQVLNTDCALWLNGDRKERPDVSDRQRAEEIRDGVVSFAWYI